MRIFIHSKSVVNFTELGWNRLKDFKSQEKFYFFSWDFFICHPELDSGSTIFILKNMKNGYIYILTNTFHWVLYIWVISELLKRIMEHKEKIAENSFSSKYNCNKLVYYEIFDNIESAILREKQLKNWKREWKIALIEKENPGWKDLFNEIKDF